MCILIIFLRSHCISISVGRGVASGQGWNILVNISIYGSHLSPEILCHSRDTRSILFRRCLLPESPGRHQLFDHVLGVLGRHDELTPLSVSENSKHEDKSVWKMQMVNSENVKWSTDSIQQQSRAASNLELTGCAVYFELLAADNMTLCRGLVWFSQILSLLQE